jgi:predicted small integral membrane protein
MIIVLFFGGFIAAGGEWFQMWRSTAWNGLEPAFRNSVLAALTLVLIHSTAPAWNREAR